MSEDPSDFRHVTRRLSKSGSWYSGNVTTLSGQISGWLAQAQREQSEDDRMSSGFPIGVIGPHAGYRFCGETLARAYCPIVTHPDRFQVTRVIILGPSHKFGWQGAAVTVATTIETPFGPIAVDRDCVDRFQKSGLFASRGTVSLRREENEHSIEMHLPFIHRAFVADRPDDAPPLRIVPIMVSHFDFHDDEEWAHSVGKLLLQELNEGDPSSTFIAVSSDFCHYGPRFRFQYSKGTPGEELWRSIEELDRWSVTAIQELDPRKFVVYWDKYRNTICGRRAIVLLQWAIWDAVCAENETETAEVQETETEPKWSWEMLGYAQSSKARSTFDSSVSYVALALWRK